MRKTSKMKNTSSKGFLSAFCCFLVIMLISCPAISLAFGAGLALLIAAVVLVLVLPARKRAKKRREEAELTFGARAS